MACAKIILDVKPTPTGTLETYHLQFEQTDNSAFYVEFNKSSIHSDAKNWNIGQQLSLLLTPPAFCRSRWE